MTADSMDPKDLDDLLTSFGWNSRIHSGISRLLSELEEAAYRHPIPEIDLIRRRLAALFSRMSPRAPLARELIEAFSTEFTAAAERLLNLTQELPLFERTMEVESMIRLRYQYLQPERREALRFPVNLPGRLLVQTRITSVALINLSLSGAQFYVRQPLQNHLTYPFAFEANFLFSSNITPKHQQVLSTGSEEKFRVGALLSPPLTWPDIRRTLIFLYGREEPAGSPRIS